MTPPRPRRLPSPRPAHNPDGAPRDPSGVDSDDLGAGSLARFGEADPSGVIGSFFARQSPDTVAAYRADLRALAQFVGLPGASDPASAGDATLNHLAAEVFGLTAGAANGLALRWSQNMEARGLAPATVSRRLASLRSLVRLGRLLGLISWTIDVRGPTPEPSRDVRGPTLTQTRDVFAHSADTQHPKRDLAILSLLFKLGLRSIEVRRLQLSQVRGLGGDRPTLMVQGKGHTKPQPVTMPPKVAAILAAWLAERPADPPPTNPLAPAPSYVFPARNGGQMSRSTLLAIVRRLGARAGIKLWPHALRHSATTEALEATGGNVHAVQKFTRHKKIETVIKYDDQRRDAGGEIAAILDDLI